MKRAVLYKKLVSGEVKCLACSWYCRISPDHAGICATRLNKNGILYSLVYGKAIGLHIDPVEKKPLYHFLPGSAFLSFGTAGCNFACEFCQNWEMSQVNKVRSSKFDPSTSLRTRVRSKEEKISEIINRMSQDLMPEEIVDMALKLKVQGIAYTYNEPAIFTEYAHDTAKIARQRDLKNVYVSNGFESVETFNYMKNHLDAINIDLKSFREDFYRKICYAKIAPVKENIQRFFDSGIETEITTLIIPGLNDSEKELTDIAEFLYKISPEIPWHISAFYPAYKMTDIHPTPHDALIKAYDIGKKIGLKYIYVGNVTDNKRSSTYCPKCNELLIERRGYEVEIKNLKSGKCGKCKTKIYGTF